MEFSHGNRLRSKIDAYEVKKARSRRVYAENQMVINPYWLNEKLLREQYNLGGPDCEVDPHILVEKGFEFEVYSKQINHKQNEIFVMTKHGYSVTPNGKMKICKL